MAIALAAMLGQIGLPGGGFGFGYGATSGSGSPQASMPLPHLPTGVNPVIAYIPVAGLPICCSILVRLSISMATG